MSAHSAGHTAWITAAAEFDSMNAQWDRVPSGRTEAMS